MRCSQLSSRPKQLRLRWPSRLVATAAEDCLLNTSTEPLPRWYRQRTSHPAGSRGAPLTFRMAARRSNPSAPALWQPARQNTCRHEQRERNSAPRGWCSPGLGVTISRHSGICAARRFPLATRVRLRARARLGEFADRAHEKSSATTKRPTPSTSHPGRIISKSNALWSTLSGETLAWMPSAIASPMNVNAAITPLSAINIHVGSSLRILRDQTSIR